MARRVSNQDPLPATPRPADAPSRPEAKQAVRPQGRADGFSTAPPRQTVTTDGRAQPRSREDVWLFGSGPGWVDPVAASAHASATLGVWKGPLFRDGAKPADVQQGQLGDCYFCAAMAGLAAALPSAVQNLIRPAGDGGAIVTFHQRDVVTGQFKPVEIRVDAELYESANGKPLYGHAAGDRQSMELWFPLVEKAWATFRGGYDVAGRGGVQNQVFEAVLGRAAGWQALDETTPPDAVWGTIRATLEAGLPLGAATRSADARYTNTGVYADHGYSVLGAEEVNGQRLVTLRNPWGSGEPRGAGVDDGVFKLPLAEFQRFFGQLQFTLL